MTAPLQLLLFGGAEVPMTEAAKRRTHTRAQGYAGSPGLGPEGETCGSCALCVGRKSAAGRTFWKCLKAKRPWTATPASDVRVRSPACEHWEPSGVDAAGRPPSAPMRKKARKRRKTKGVRRLPERLE